MRWIGFSLLAFIFLLAGISFLNQPEQPLVNTLVKASQPKANNPITIPQRSVSQIHEEEDSWGPELYNKILAIQVTADKSHGTFLSWEDTKSKLDRVCNDFFSMASFNFHVCEMMLTNPDVGESMSEIIADYRYAENNQEKVNLRLRLIEIYAQLKGLAFSQNYVTCSSTGIKVHEGLNEEYLEISFDSLIAGVNIGSHSFDSANFHESIQQLIEQLDDKTKTLGKDVPGLLIVQNHEREEIQTCLYVQRFEGKDFKMNDDELFVANARSKDPDLKKKNLDQALMTVTEELRSRMLNHGVSPFHGPGKVIFEREKKQAEERRAWLLSSKPIFE